MKKLLLSLLVLTSVSIAYVSCTNDESVKKQTSNSKISIPLTDYGFYHNEALALYYKKHTLYSKSKNGVENKKSDLVIKEMTEDLKEKYPKEFENVKTEDIRLAFKDIDSGNFDIVTFWNSKKEALFISNKISRKVGSLVDEILKTDMKYAQYVLKIEDFKSKNSLTPEEENQIILFESVLKSSNEYWNSKNSTKGKSAKPGSKVIVADTLGALMFAYSGPGAIIAGGISSLFVNEALPPLQVPTDELPIEDNPNNPRTITIE
nr:hypothetical protein [uncultured Flavobacterium sp.]